jgi:hypothetical protein
MTSKANRVLRTLRGLVFAGLGVLSPLAFAQPAIDLSRSQVDGLYAPSGGASNAQSFVLTNSGSDTLTIGSVSMVGPNPANFTVTGACVGGNVSIAPAQQCLFDVVFHADTSDASAIFLINTNAGNGTTPVLLVGHVANPDPTMPYAFATFAPPYVDFGVQTIGSPGPTIAITLTSTGSNRPFTIASMSISGRSAADFTLATTCTIGGALDIGQSCTLFVQFVPLTPGPLSAEVDIQEPTLAVPIPIALTGIAAGSVQPIVDVVEYYNATLDHYFITWVPSEQANLDAGNTPTRWTRTGQTFKAFPVPQSLSSPVCRYYIPPAFGDSHFFGRGDVECTATGQQHPEFVLESPAFMYMYLPAAGACPANTTPVYRVFSNRPDANHRYMTLRSIRDFMVSQGWLAEGDGPDLVVMCAPQ